MFQRSKRIFSRALSVVGVDINNAANSVTFHAQSGASVSVCREWLVDNDVALRHSTGQKTQSLFDLPAYNAVGGSYSPPPFIRACRLPTVNSPRLLDVEFETGNTFQIRESDILKYLFGKQKLGRSAPLPSVKALHRVSMNAFVSDTKSDSHVDALKRLAMDGLILIENCPSDDASVLEIARSIDREMPTLYDTEFKVVSAPQSGPKNNVAYSQVELDLHQDIAYYESMPGLQLLHCQKFDARCTGGESTFLDVIHAGEVLRERDAAAFKALCEIPAAFMKDDLDRPVPAQYYYATPHFHVNDMGEITKCFWSPAFEAPVPPSARMAEYYAARKTFCDVLAELKQSPYFLEFRMKEGDCVVFHQGRMLHGRREFTEPHAGARQLHGCYVNVDTFRNAVVTRVGARSMDEVQSLPGFGNQSFR